MRFDLILKGGHLIDPSQDIDGPQDIAFINGNVALIDPDIDSKLGATCVDTSGSFVTPGLIDLHTHVYWGGTSLGIDADSYCRKSGVTTVVDTGSAGPGNFVGFRKHVIEKSKFRILAYLHISHAGIYAFSNRVMVGESENIQLMDPISAIEVIEANRDIIVGIKVRLGKRTSGRNGFLPYEFAIDVAEKTGLPIMVHIDEAPPSYSEVISKMRTGDILTHCFRPSPNGPIGIDGHILPAVLKASARGVIFDIGHGMGSLSFQVARKMLKNEFNPDTISSDIHALCIDGPVYDQLTTLSKFLNLGMPIFDLIRSTTENCANAMLRPELGTLKIGTVGDVSILNIVSGKFQYSDVLGDTFYGDTKIKSSGLVLNGTFLDSD